MIQILRETHEAPASVARRLAIAGGTNRFGEPNYRAVWGWSRLGWIGGKWEDRDPANGALLRETMELRYVPKYAPHDRWHIERWLAPEAYGSPLEWYAQTLDREEGVTLPALGPYPARGEYEHCFTLQGPRGEFVQLTPTVAEYIARAIETGRHTDPARRRAGGAERERRSDLDFDAWAYDMLDDACPALHGAPFVSMPSSAEKGTARGGCAEPSEQTNTDSHRRRGDVSDSSCLATVRDRTSESAASE